MSESKKLESIDTTVRVIDRETLVSFTFKPTIEAVDIPEMGGKVYIKELSAAEWDNYQSSLIVTGKGGKIDLDKKNATAKLLVLAIVDQNGKRLLTDRDADKIGQFPRRVVSRLEEVARRLSGMNDDDSGDGDEEPAVKN